MTLNDRLKVIGEKLERLQRDGWTKHKHQFCVEAHRFVMRPRLTDAQVGAFEEEHGMRLPEDYRAFLLELGDGGAGPYYGLLSLSRWADLAEQQEGCLATVSPLVPGRTYEADWAERLGIAEDPYRGVLPIAERGCGGYCALIVSGEARGRVVYVEDGPPYFVWDQSFLDWYERWLDELIEGVSVAEFGYTRGGAEAELVESYRNAAALHERAEIPASLGRRSPITSLSHSILIEAVEHPDWRLRATALHALGKAGSEFMSIVVAKLADTNPMVREAVAKVLRSHDRVRPYVSELNAALERETNATSFFAICSTLESVNGIDVATLRRKTEGDDVGLRRYAAHFLGKMSPKPKTRPWWNRWFGGNR